MRGACRRCGERGAGFSDVTLRPVVLLAVLTLAACGGDNAPSEASSARSSKPPVDPSLVVVRPVLGDAPSPCSEGMGRQVQLPDPANPQSCLTLGDVIVDASEVSSARLVAVGAGSPTVSLGLTEAGQHAFQQFGTLHIGERTALIVNGRVVSTPTLQSANAAGLAISGLAADEAAELVRRFAGDSTTPTTSPADKDLDRAEAICDRYDRPSARTHSPWRRSRDGNHSDDPTAIGPFC